MAKNKNAGLTADERDTQVNDLKTQIHGVKDEINELRAQIQAKKDQITPLKGQLRTLKGTPVTAASAEEGE